MGELLCKTGGDFLGILVVFSFLFPFSLSIYGSRAGEIGVVGEWEGKAGENVMRRIERNLSTTDERCVLLKRIGKG